MATKQYTLWGDTINLDHTEAKVRRVLEVFPEARGNDKELILRVWLEEDGLAEVLGEAEARFSEWFRDQATYPESITRMRRKVQAEGEYLPEPQVQERRARLQELWRGHFSPQPLGKPVSKLAASPMV